MAKVIAVTVCRNEEETIRRCVNSVKNQSVPLFYVVVDDNSTDRTPEILKECNVPFIRLGNLKTNLTGFRLPFGIIKGVKYAEKYCKDWDYLLKVDADVIIPPNYVEYIVRQMEKSPQIGIASGIPMVRERHGYVLMGMDKDHADDGARVYRRECWNSLEVYGTIGYDSHLLFSARQKGWKTTHFNITFREERPWGKRTLSWWIGRGTARFVLGYPLHYQALFAASKIFQKPVLFGSLSMFLAYLLRHLTPGYRVFTDEYYSYVKEYLTEMMLRKIHKYKKIFGA